MICEYPQKMTVTFEGSITDSVPAESADIVFIGSEGRLQIFRSGYRFLPKGARNTADQVVGKGTRDTHMQNWIDCIRSRKEPNATVEQGHFGAMACHMGNIAYLLQRRVTWDPSWDLPV
jgi:hypothetical protein